MAKAAQRGEEKPLQRSVSFRDGSPGLHPGSMETAQASDPMASEKLKEGIKGFSGALVNLVKLLAGRLAAQEAIYP
jgi:hypothetical protein